MCSSLLLHFRHLLAGIVIESSVWLYNENKYVSMHIWEGSNL